MEKIRFINDDDGTEIQAGKLRIVLPDNSSFFIESLSGREGSAVFMTPAESTEDSTINIFSIEPGACNLFSVSISKVARKNRP